MEDSSEKGRKSFREVFCNTSYGMLYKCMSINKRTTNSMRVSGSLLIVSRTSSQDLYRHPHSSIHRVPPLRQSVPLVVAFGYQFEEQSASLGRDI